MSDEKIPAPEIQNEVVVDDASTVPSYTNFCRVTATPEEVILDFGLNPQPFATGRQDVKANQRIVMNFYTAKRLLSAMGMTIQRHEGTFGSVELDVRRRAGAYQARPIPPLGLKALSPKKTDRNTFRCRWIFTTGPLDIPKMSGRSVFSALKKRLVARQTR